MAPTLRRLLKACLSLALAVSLVACSGAQSAQPGIPPEDMAVITRQAEGYLASMERLPELAALVSQRNWIFARNLIHGPMQEVGREMLYINQRLLPGDRAEANSRAAALKRSMAELDEAARLQEPMRMDRAYSGVAAGFASYAEVIPAQAIASIQAAADEAAARAAADSTTEASDEGDDAMEAMGLPAA
ncbi:photosystem II protein PsbQ [Synechococcus sp. RSCCF101]|uniref:photosystem II protein PsbQ n=1 Tax=Synechococcus sp. RSCCF101 TaxID=2511069 RepID=UPI0012493CB6|nr:photosystem II protein PsbQ [Synechococcus sp. RSCCF101]